MRCDVRRQSLIKFLEMILKMYLNKMVLSKNVFLQYDQEVG